MISKSDLVILVLASSALAVGVYRWHQNTQDVSTITIPASNRVVVEPKQSFAEVMPTVSSEQNRVNQVTVQTIPAAEPVPEIVVGNTVAQTESIRLGSHQVRSGDYLGKIANQYGTDVQTLRDINDISGNLIQIGQEILYPL